MIDKFEIIALIRKIIHHCEINSVYVASQKSYKIKLFLQDGFSWP